MRPASLRALLALAVAAGPVRGAAQHEARGNTPAVAPSREATQWDFLVGQWDLTVKPKVSSLAARIHGAPRLLGTWKAWKAFDWFGIEDDLRIVDGSGNPRSLTHAVRVYSPSERRWNVSTLDVYRMRFTPSTAEWRDGEMIVTARGTDTDGKPMLTRGRFHAITSGSFRLRQDRSSDDGRTWDEGVLVIEAKRVAAQAPR